MSRARNPHYDLAHVKELVVSGHYGFTSHSIKWLTHKGYDPDLAREAISCLEPYEFYDSKPPYDDHEYYADIYYCQVDGIEEDLYLKFTVEGETLEIVELMDCKEWGYIL